jgi:hypothetical protein
MFCFSRRVYSFNVRGNPSDEVVFERSFDNLMQQIWREKFMDICSWKFISKWLGLHSVYYVLL